MGGGLLLSTGLLDDVVDRRFNISSTTSAGSLDDRVVFGDRRAEAEAAWGEFTSSPIIGQGPGVVDLQWNEDGRALRARFVHNEYLELLVTHGVLGAIGLFFSAWLMVRRRGAAAAPAIVTPALAGFGVHSAIDFLWHIPVLPLVLMLIAAIAFDGVERRRSPIG